jgi:hypothetical protein
MPVRSTVPATPCANTTPAIFPCNNIFSLLNRRRSLIPPRPCLLPQPHFNTGGAMTTDL